METLEIVSQIVKVTFTIAWAILLASNVKAFNKQAE